MFTHTFYYKTEIQKPLPEVWSFFQSTAKLAEITAFPKITVIGNTDVYKDAPVHLKLNVFIFSFHWKGKITEVIPTAYFIDEGETLPFPFKKWKHIHAFKEIDDKSTKMIDQVDYVSYLPPSITTVFLKKMFSDRKRSILHAFQSE